MAGIANHRSLKSGRPCIPAGSGNDNRRAPTGSLSTGRDHHTATLFGNGKVLIAGGGALNGPLSSAEVYDPVAGTFSSTTSLNNPRLGAAATLLNNGQVLIVGGAGNKVLNSAELY